jgi:hypothetical protein
MRIFYYVFWNVGDSLIMIDMLVDVGSFVADILESKDTVYQT